MERLGLVNPYSSPPPIYERAAAFVWFRKREQTRFYSTINATESEPGFRGEAGRQEQP